MKKKIKLTETQKTVLKKVGQATVLIAAFGVGYKASGYIHDLKTGLGLMKLHEAGIVKFFDENGVEVGCEEACKVMERFADKK